MALNDNLLKEHPWISRPEMTVKKDPQAALNGYIKAKVDALKEPFLYALLEDNQEQIKRIREMYNTYKLKMQQEVEWYNTTGYELLEVLAVPTEGNTALSLIASILRKEEQRGGE